MILERVPESEEGRSTLMACALVATSWRGPSQRRLFSSVLIDEYNYKSWMNCVVSSGYKAHLLKFVRSLTHWRDPNPKTKYPMENLPQDSGEYLSALPNIRTLKLYHIRIERISEEGFRTCFSAFRETLTALSLGTFDTSFSAFVTLVDYFPNITSLELGSIVLEPDEEPAPVLSRPLRGKVHVWGAHASRLEFLGRFVKLELEYDELVLDSFSHLMETAFLERALQISASTVKFLRLAVGLERE